MRGRIFRFFAGLVVIDFCLLFGGEYIFAQGRTGYDPTPRTNRNKQKSRPKGNSLPRNGQKRSGKTGRNNKVKKIPDYYNQGLDYELQENSLKAIESFSSALLTQPNNADIYYHRAETYYNEASKSKDHSAALETYFAAISDYEHAIKIAPDFTLAHYHLGKVYSAIGDFDTAIRNYDKAAGLSPKTIEPLYYIYLNRAEANKREGDYAAAISDFDRAIEINAQNYTAFVHRAEAHQKNSQYEEAINDYKKALQLYDFHLDASTSPEQAGRMQQAIDVRIERFKDAITQVQASQKAVEDRVRELTAAVTASPNDSKAYYNRGNFYLSTRDLDNAIKDYKKVVDLDANHTYAYLGLGDAYAGQKNDAEAISAYAEAIRRADVEMSKAAHYRRGLFFSSRSNYAEAIKDYSESINLATKDQPPGAATPREARVYFFSRGLERLKNKEYDEARKDFDTCIQINDKDHEAYFRRAEALDALGQKDLADQDRRAGAKKFLQK